mmetsp:Transcript_2110/g.3138  ORF Transcript_2110/g.3138 Transcript_2110/m.3138 type:complete len:115 (-) Transcript_2110:2341-2685(-)
MQTLILKLLHHSAILRFSYKHRRAYTKCKDVVFSLLLSTLITLYLTLLGVFSLSRLISSVDNCISKGYRWILGTDVPPPSGDLATVEITNFNKFALSDNTELVSKVTSRVNQNV